MLVISKAIRDKIARDDHGAITEREVRECFMTWDGRYCYDDREEHLTDPPTRWFVEESHIGRTIKIIYVSDDENVYLKSAYLASGEIKRIFDKFGRKGE